MSFSIQIVTHNSARTIQTCLESVSHQLDVAFDLCIIDNASSDETVSMILAAGFDVTVNVENTGYAAAHNQALELTTSPYVLTLNPDVRLEPGYLRRIQALLDSDPRCGSAMGLILRVDDLDDDTSIVDSAGTYMRRSRRQGLRFDGAPVDSVPNGVAPIFGPDGAAAVYRRAMLEDIAVDGEIFDEDFFIHKEDIDINWRAQLRGWTSALVPEARARHVRTFRPGNRADIPPEVRIHAVRNRYLLMLKNDRLPHLLADLWFIAPYEAAIWAYMLARERDSLWALLKSMPLFGKMLPKRGIIQQRRVIDWRDLRRRWREEPLLGHTPAIDSNLAEETE
ncbi:MAG: glycosyltransferase family 2 protein [Anaerolineae bacterium]|nr:glycosyltransferase family 2 protein [Anaerolineae bacterium]